MSISEYLIVSYARTSPFWIILYKVSLTYFTTAVAFKKGLEDTHPLKRYMLMMWMADADDIAMFCVLV